MDIQTPGGSELSPMPKPEMRTSKPPEVKPPEVKPLGQTEQAMVARIDKDGDPDLVLRDLTKTDVPQVITSPREVQASGVQTTKTPDSARQQTSNVNAELPKDSKAPSDTRDTPPSSENGHSPSKPLFINEDPRFDAIAKELSDESLERSIKSLLDMGKSREEALQHMEVFGGARRHPDGSLRVQFYPQKIHSVFAERYPEDYAGYQKIEPLGENYQDHGHRAFRYRQIARYNPERARQMAEAHQSRYGEPNAELVRAIQQTEELKQNPITAPSEDPKYAELADNMQIDPAFKAIQDELHVSDWQSVLGADYQNRIKQMTTDQYSELINSDKVFGLSSSKDRRAKELFRERFPDRARLYREREITRVYRDPDGVINPQLDPEYRGLDRSQMFEDRSLRDFARRFPEKAAAYADVNPKLKTVIEQVQLESRTQHTPSSLEANRRATSEAVQQSINETTPSPTPSEGAETKTQQQTDVKDKPTTEPQTPQAERVGERTQALVDSLRNIGVEAQAVPIENSGIFTDAIILPKKEQPTEKMVRVYRGVNQVDTSLLQQLPYAMRADSESGWGSVVLDNVRQEVDVLATEPTYEHLMTYVTKARPQMNEAQQRRLDRDLAKMEDGILKGHSMRTELIYDQIGHNGGSADSGISPYLSASWSPNEALGYTRPDGALLVIDVPLSQIEDFGKDGTETNIKGALDPNNITAIIPRNGVDNKDPQATEQAINNALQAVSESAKVPVYDAGETQVVRAQEDVATKEKDKQQWEIDVQAVRLKRVGNLVGLFSEIGLDPQVIQQSASEAGIDVYTKAKIDIFNYYADRLSKIGRGGRNVEDYDYIAESEYGVRRNFDRATISDEMLVKLRDMVQRQEQREQKQTTNS